ncbi:hypothetical protein [Sphingomonas crusticola]|uniref:hypothetical protein n=1 Tax=Sphingomonas crusticola TaxID=1697973 RepID=UPI0013C32CC0|nr:hypothetical protein [Sphingomonas crusticola]
MPTFRAQTDWLKLPDRWIMGDVTAVAVDRRNYVWVLQRPRTLSADQKDKAAPPVLLFDTAGQFVSGFGGPGIGYDWPQVEHSLAVDAQGHVWITGNARPNGGAADDMLLEFTAAGKFLRQIGRPGESRGNADTANFHAPADLFVDDANHEVYVADGYGNRRVIVVDSRNGAFRRMWGAFGSVPTLQPAPAPRPAGAPATPETGDGPPDFNGVHGVELSRDGLVYVSDRNNQRLQVFTRAGHYLRQVFIDRNMASPVTASGIAMSADAAQRYLFVVDFGNAALVVLDRQRLQVIGRLDGTHNMPAFRAPHLIAADGKGALYVAEVAGRRVQRLTYTPR